MKGVTYIESFLNDHENVFNYLKEHVTWDERMRSRKTASYGVAYNYSQLSYPFQPMLPTIEQICLSIASVLKFEPNNCLVNYYLDGKSKMGFHSDQTDILASNTGVAIVSLGENRTFRFRNIKHNSETADFLLLSGSLLYMLQSVQQEWEHAIPASDTNKGRMSLTFRKMVGD